MKIVNDTLEFDVYIFKDYLITADSILSDLLPYIEKHRRLSRDKFEIMWNSDLFNDDANLFIAYIFEEKNIIV